MEAVRKHFYSKIGRGVVPTAKELMQYAAKRNLSGVTLEKVKLLKLERKFLARYERVKRPSAYAKTSSYRYGVCQVDIAFMNKHHRRMNSGAIGFIVCVEVSSLQVALEAVTDKTKESYREGLKKIMETSSINKISTVLSDQEKALANPDTVAFLKRQYGIKLLFLKVRNKAYLAELFVGIVKKMLNIALSHARKEKKSNSLRWVDFLKPIEKHLNSRKVPGTTFTRSSVNEFNYMQMRNEQENGEAYANMNLNALPSNVLGARDGSWNRELFKYARNDRVLLDLRALGGVSRRKLFHKGTVSGGYSKKLYLVDSAMLRLNKKGGYTPVYKVRARGGRRALPQWFYESDLQKVTPKEEEPEYSSDEQE